MDVLDGSLPAIHLYTDGLEMQILLLSSWRGGGEACPGRGEGEGGINSFEGSLKTNGGEVGEECVIIKGLRNYSGAECCFRVAFSAFSRAI